VMSTYISVIFTGYCHIGSQQGRVSMQENRALKEAWKGRGLVDYKCDLARGPHGSVNKIIKFCDLFMT
jgi:hypothetical protein